MLFRANSLFRNFEVLGDGDRVLIYLVLFTGDCLERIGKGKAATKLFFTMNSMRG